MAVIKKELKKNATGVKDTCKVNDCTGCGALPDCRKSAVAPLSDFDTTRRVILENQAVLFEAGTDNDLGR